jgi:hypothetical protein
MAAQGFDFLVLNCPSTGRREGTVLALMARVHPAGYILVSRDVFVPLRLLRICAKQRSCSTRSKPIVLATATQQETQWRMR